LKESTSWYDYLVKLLKKLFLLEPEPKTFVLTNVPVKQLPDGRYIVDFPKKKKSFSEEFSTNFWGHIHDINEKIASFEIGELTAFFMLFGFILFVIYCVIVEII
jgi:hypothetical protein